MTAAQKDFLEEGIGGPPEDRLEALYATAVLARRLDEALRGVQRRGEIGFYIGSRGEEVCGVAAAAALEPEDWVFPGLRPTAVCLQRGMPLDAWMHQAFGTPVDPALGRRVPTFPSWREGRIVPVSPSLGTHIVQATGFAWAARMRGEPRAVLAIFGDGSVGQPDFHTGLNFAGVCRAPAVFLWKSTAGEDCGEGTVEERARAYGIRSLSVDGGELADVYDAVHRASGIARSGEGATLVQARLPRAEECEGDLDPLARLRARLLAKELWSEEKESALETEVGERIASSMDRARRAGTPTSWTLFEDVYATRPPHLEEQRKELASDEG